MAAWLPGSTHFSAEQHLLHSKDAAGVKLMRRASCILIREMVFACTFGGTLRHCVIMSGDVLFLWQFFHIFFIPYPLWLAIISFGLKRNEKERNVEYLQSSTAAQLSRMGASLRPQEWDSFWFIFRTNKANNEFLSATTRVQLKISFKKKKKTETNINKLTKNKIYIKVLCVKYITNIMKK